MRWLLILIAVAALVGAALPYVWARGPSVAGAQAFAFGRFVIEAHTRRLSAGGFPNTSGNPFATRPTVDYSVRHDGQSISVPGAGGKPERVFWEARALPEAPEPAVLVASLGVWLLTEGDEGQPVVTTLAEPTSDFATLQWLDANDGQPGDEYTISMREQAVTPPLFGGGRRLLVNRRAVLDVATLQVQAFSPTAYNPDLEGFSPSGEAARMASPDGRQVVFAASRNAGDDYGYDYALVAVDIATNAAYAVPFPRTPTRFDSVWDIDRAWLAHYFDWQREGDGYRLHYRDDVAPLPWRGRVSRMEGERVEYRLNPVSPRIQSVLADFIVRTEGATREGDGLRVGEARLVLAYDEARQALVLYAEPGLHSREGSACIERIARGFDAELATRRHDALFGSLEGAR